MDVFDFGALGDGVADDTAAIQRAIDACFGPSSAPHGTNAFLNRRLRFPPGRYRTTAPLVITQLQGGMVEGAGRFVSTINNVTPGSPVFATNGCGYAQFSSLRLLGTGAATLFDLNWDNTPGGAALQSNSFRDMMFEAGAIGINIGAGNFMGSENLFQGCYWARQTVAGLKTSNYNALQQTVLGGNFQDCAIGIWVAAGSVNTIAGVGFQNQTQWDIKVENSANDTMHVSGCRSESRNFLWASNRLHLKIAACSHLNGNLGTFVSMGNCIGSIEDSVSIGGNIDAGWPPRLGIRHSSFGRVDWLNYHLNQGQFPDGQIEIEDVQYGGTPNGSGAGNPKRILRQRIDPTGVHDYALAA